MKKIILIGLLLSILSGCSSNKSGDSTASKSSKPTATSEMKAPATVNSSQASQMSTESKSSTTQSNSSASTKTGNQLWSVQKKAQLQQFMADWGQRMNQTYKEYTPGNSINFNGVQAPDGLVGNVTMQPAIGQHPIYLEWSENGQVKDGYALVAVYSDAETQPEMQKHLYLFTIVNNQPLVLVTMQNQGDPYGYLYFGATDNAELRAGFEKIVGAPSITKEQIPNISVNPWSSKEEAIDFYEGMYKNTANEISTQIDWHNFQRANWREVETKGDTMTLHFANVGGAGGSYTQFTKVGTNTVVVSFDGNAAYPDNPSSVLLVQNNDYKVLRTLNQ